MPSAASLGIVCSAGLLLTACGSSTPPGASPPAPTHGTSPHGHGAHSHGEHAHHHGHGQGPLVHGFDNAAEWAKKFDDPERDARQKPAEVVTLLQLAPGMKVADIGAGTGTGYFEPHLSRAVGPTGQVLALDVEESMVTYLKERIAREKLTNVTATKVEYDDPKLAPASLDRVLIVDVWHHIAGRDAYAAKVRDGLAPGGLVVIVDYTMEAADGPPKEMRVTADQIKKELESAGLTADLATETLPDQYVVIGRRSK